jgi:hypothetical protein
VEKVAKDLGYQLYFWNVDTLDWRESHRPDGWVSHEAYPAVPGGPRCGMRA